MSGASVRIDPVTLGATVAINDNARPKAIADTGLLWVDGSWGGYVGCADAVTGAILWRQSFDKIPIMLARGVDGRTVAYKEWTQVEPPPVCTEH
jgi:hypothetical protein